MVNEVVVLTLLLAEPKHGYRLLAEADLLLGPDETFDTKRLYTTLRRLELQGAIVASAEPSPRPGAPQRKVYRTTAQGMELLRSLIADPANAQDRRRFFVSLALWVFISPSEQRTLLQKRLAWLDGERRHMEAVAALPDHTPWSTAVHTFQRQQVREEVQWLKDLAEEMGIDGLDG
jgi:DNA-binding PadR family transcriptional regulator